MPNFISEDQIEIALVQKLQHLHGFDALDCHTEDPEDLNDGSGRSDKREVILLDRVREEVKRKGTSLEGVIAGLFPVDRLRSRGSEKRRHDFRSSWITCGLWRWP